jgi:hypothetical protein
MPKKDEKEPAEPAAESESAPVQATEPSREDQDRIRKKLLKKYWS